MAPRNGSYPWRFFAGGDEVSTTTLILVVAVAVAIIVALAASRSGPRVTHIETRRESEDRNNGDDA